MDSSTHVIITDYWVDENNTSGFLELWNWCTMTGDENQSLHCMVPRWTIKIEGMLDEFHLLMAQRVNCTNHCGLSHFYLDIGCLDGAMVSPKGFDYTAVKAWRWFVSENTVVHLNFHCKRYHRPCVEFVWANRMITLFTYIDCRETNIVITLSGCTFKDIKNLVGLYLRVLQESEQKDLNHTSLTVCHDIRDEHPDVIRPLQNEAAFVLRGRHPIPTNLVSIVFTERIPCAD